MRMACTAAKVFAGVALLPGLVFAQANRSANSFNDSWFWGVSGGVMLFKAGVDRSTQITAPSVGGEWLITRTRVGLRLSVEQAFFNEQAGIFDPSSSGGVREIDVKNWRRYSGEIYFFPVTDGNLRPYAGLGVALNVIQNSVPTGSFSSEGQMDSVFASVNEFSSRSSAVFTVGAQMGFNRSALFVQASAMPTGGNFLLNRSHYTYMAQGGIRYNFGNAIDKF